MTPPADHPTPPHIQLLDAPELRPFDHALADVRARWEADVARHSVKRDERTVFSDHRVSTDASA